MMLIRCSQKKARRTERFFSMVEVAMALAVVAIGVVSIVALFPIGMEASRDAIADSYAADSAETLLHYKAVLGKVNAPPADTIRGWTALLANILTTKPGSTEGSWGSPQLIPGTTTRMTESSTDKGLFKLEMDPDFSGVFRLWRSTVAYSYYDGSWKSAPLSEESAVALNLEVSWPSQAPYEKRRRATYYLEVFNPN